MNQNKPYEVHNTSTLTDSWCGSYPSKAAAEAAREEWQRTWPTNTYEVRQVDPTP